jgi:hypothetical protein
MKTEHDRVSLADIFPTVAYDAQQAYCEADESAAAEAEMRAEFLALCATGDLDAYAGFAPPVRDERCFGGLRTAKLFDVLEDAIDYDDFQRCMFAVLLKASHTDGDASELLERMAAKFASMNTI